MATHAIVAVQLKDGDIYAKLSHYGSIEDYRDEIRCASYDEFFESVMLGDSTEPFDGSYLDVNHCVNELGWSVEEFVKEMPSHCPKRFETLEKLFKYAEEFYASFIYLMHEDADCTLNVYEFHDHLKSFVDIAENVDDIEPFNVDNIDDFDLKSIKDELESAYDEVDEFYDEDESMTEKHGLDYDAIERCTTKEEAIKLCKKFNEELPKIKAYIKENLL